MIENLPIEIFLGYVGICLALPIFGFIVRQTVPISLFLFISGGMLVALFIILDSINMGMIPVSSTVTGDTTTYEFEPNPYLFTEEIKTYLILISSMLMIIGAVVELKAR